MKYISQSSNLATKTGDFVVEVDARVDMQLDFIRRCNGSGGKSLTAIVANSIDAKNLCDECKREKKTKPGSIMSSITVEGATFVGIGGH